MAKKETLAGSYMGISTSTGKPLVYGPPLTREDLERAAKIVKEESAFAPKPLLVSPQDFQDIQKLWKEDSLSKPISNFPINIQVDPNLKPDEAYMISGDQTVKIKLDKIKNLIRKIKNLLRKGAPWKL